jgi:hypothetical protein
MDENGELLVHSHNILYRWQSYFSQLLNIHNVNDVRQIEIHSAEPPVPGPSHLEVEISIAKLKKYESLSSDQILAEVIQARGEKFVSKIHELTNSCGAEYHSHGHKLCSHSVDSQHFMEPECSLPSTQELPTCTYPKSDQSSPQHSILSLKGPS